MNFLNRRLLLTLTICFAVSCGSRASSRQPKRTEVRLATTRGALVYLPVFVAGPAGCFEKQNLDVRIEETEGAPKSMTALLAGTVDIAAAGYLHALDLRAQGGLSSLPGDGTISWLCPGCLTASIQIHPEDRGLERNECRSYVSRS